MGIRSAAAEDQADHLRAGQDEGARNFAVLVSLVVTCEANGINPHDYLTDMLLRVQDHPQSQIDELLPTEWGNVA